MLHSGRTDTLPEQWDGSRGLSAWQVRAACACLLVGLLALDFETTRLNPSIAYVGLLAICVQWGDRKRIWHWGLAIVGLTYIGYFFGARSATVGSRLELLHKYAMTNRTFAACAILGITVLSRTTTDFAGAWPGGRGFPQRRGGRSRWIAALISDEISAMGICFVAALAIFVLDLLLPVQYNLPILYGIVVMLASRTQQSRSFVWWFTASLLALTVTGYLAPPAGPELRECYVVNRLLAMSMIATVAIAVRRSRGGGAARVARPHLPATAAAAAAVPRVLHVISGIHPRSGGPTSALAGFSSAQAAVGGDVSIISTWSTEEEVLVAQRLRAVGVKVRLVGPARGPLMRHPDLTAEVAEAVDQADVIHIHGVWEEIQHFAAGHARRCGIPYIVRPCGMLDHWSLAQHRFRKAIYLAWRMRDDLNGAAALHLTSRAECEAIEPLGLRAPLIIEPLGLDLGEFDPLPAPGSFRGRHPMLGRSPCVLFYGRVCAKKGLHLLIPAMALLAERDAKLVIAGPVDSEYREHLEDLIERQGLRERVMFTGMLTGRDRIAVLADADLFVLPSAEENFGVAVAEAMAARCPVIVSPQVAVAQQVLEWGAGDVAPLDPWALARTIDRWLASPERRREAGLRGSQGVFEHFDWKRIALDWPDHYQHLLSIAQRRGVHC